MNEYRATYKRPYSNPECPGYSNPRARQGYYVCGENIFVAGMKAFERIKSVHPSACAGDCEVELWKKNISFSY